MLQACAAHECRPTCYVCCAVPCLSVYQHTLHPLLDVVGKEQQALKQKSLATRPEQLPVMPGAHWQQPKPTAAISASNAAFHSMNRSTVTIVPCARAAARLASSSAAARLASSSGSTSAVASARSARHT